jgi:hypothetical protein
MSKKAIAFALAATLIAAGAAGTALAAEASIAVSVAPGPAYSHKVKFGLIAMNLTPQTAIWIETADGRFVDTIYVTEKAATGKWSAAGGARRPEALPIWSHARGIAAPDGLYMPDKAHRLPDAVSGATPKAAFAKTWKLPPGLAPGSYLIKAELNSSFDWNEAYPDKLPKTDPRWTEANGQPSVLWQCALELGGAAARASLAPVGRGALRGEDGAVKPGLEGITSARELAASITAEYKP